MTITSEPHNHTSRKDKETDKAASTDGADLDKGDYARGRDQRDRQADVWEKTLLTSRQTLV